ncbi:hypothetical protein KNT87_gp186 [Erwinia phage Cronus]|uniref:Uncharacterized protein n=1 Tax=Erwinia phage Cronus TaxID=2163633 RepID=A0A2S1GM12_9CAUD|nr:hypothetical protein KNT87_gp186 [Erwinia phage Cronus]AWD90383.1 hypothetical protein [Erwinia phage Cronus]
MKYVFKGQTANLAALVVSQSFRDFLDKNKKDTTNRYSIAGTYKGNDGITYIESVCVNTGFSSSKRFNFPPTEFMSIDRWNLLFNQEDKFINETICNKRYKLRSTNRTGKFSVSTSVVKNLFVRNTVWKLAVYGINSKDESKKPEVIPLSVKNGHIVRLAILKPGCILPEEIVYQTNKAPSINGFLDIYEEVDNNGPEEFLTPETAAKIIDLVNEALIPVSFSGSTTYIKTSNEFTDLIKGLVK